MESKGDYVCFVTVFAPEFSVSSAMSTTSSTTSKKDVENNQKRRIGNRVAVIGRILKGEP